MYSPQTCRSARSSSRSGFTLVEILVVIAIIALLAGVALPAVTGAIKKARENAALQTAHGLASAMFQYSTDNSGVFPGKIGAATAASSEELFNDLLVPNYVPNTDPLWISGGSGSKYSGTMTAGSVALTSANVSWDFTVHSDLTGLVANDPDVTPVIISTGSTISYPAASGTKGAPVTAEITGTTNPFGTDGVAVGYKDMSSQFASSSNQGGSASKGFDISSVSYIGQNTLAQVVP